MFTLKINTGNAAFRTHLDWDESEETSLDPYACELRRLLDEVQKQLICGMTEGRLIDINGNRVGEWTLD